MNDTGQENAISIAGMPSGRRRTSMNGIIQIVSGLVIGCAGFHQIAEHPLQGICALFLAGFLVMIGFEKKLAERSRGIRN
jgi:hypothetical protein